MGIPPIVRCAGFLLLSSVGALAFAEAPHLLVPGDPEYGPGDAAVLSVTDDGYVVVWWDYRDWGTPGRPNGGFRSVRSDFSGSASEPEILTVDEHAFPVGLERTGDGYVLVAQVDAWKLMTAELDRDARQKGPPIEFLERIELYRAAVASTSTGIVVTWPEWLGAYGIRAQGVNDDGTPVGTPVPVATGSYTGPFFYESPLACDASGCTTAWYAYPIGVFLRDVSGSGRPARETVSAETGPISFFPVLDVALVSGVTAIVYSSGSPQRDLFLVRRDKTGKVSAPVAIAAEPYDEANVPYWEDAAPLQVVDGGDRIGVLYFAAPPSPGPSWRYLFAEFDLAGQRVGPVRDLYAEFTFDPHGNPDLRRDSKRDRYVLAWAGNGPNGEGVYVTELVPSR